MTITLRTTAHVDEDGRITVQAPGALPAGDHEVVVTIEPARPGQPAFRLEHLPRHEGSWDHSVSLRREDIYGDDIR